MLQPAASGTGAVDAGFLRLLIDNCLTRGMLFEEIRQVVVENFQPDLRRKGSKGPLLKFWGLRHGRGRETHCMFVDLTYLCSKEASTYGQVADHAVWW